MATLLPTKDESDCVRFGNYTTQKSNVKASYDYDKGTVTFIENGFSLLTLQFNQIKLGLTGSIASNLQQVDDFVFANFSEPSSNTGGFDGNAANLTGTISSARQPGYLAAGQTTAQIQAFINANRKVIWGAGNHDINSPLDSPNDTVFEFEKGVNLRGGLTMSGELLTHARLFKIENRQNIKFINPVFGDPLSNFQNNDEYGSAFMHFYNCKNIEIINPKVYYSGSRELDAVWFSGPTASGLRVSGGRFEGLGITYTEAGASDALLYDIQVKNCKKNAFSGIGNGVDYGGGAAVYCRVTNCTATNTGRMGWEEIGQIKGTRVVNFISNVSGALSKYANEGFGMSATAQEWRIREAHITDAKKYGIETFGNTGAAVSGCTILWSDQSTVDRTGIIANFTISANSSERTHGLTIRENSITNATIGINIAGSYNPTVRVENNNILNPTKFGIYGDVSDVVGGKVSVTGNTVEVSTPSIAGSYDQRRLYFFYTNNTGVFAKIADNFAFFNPEATGGAKPEAAFYVQWPNAVVDSNEVIGNNIKSAANQTVEGFHSGGSSAANIKFIYNQNSGANNFFSTYTNAYFSKNSFEP